MHGKAQQEKPCLKNGLPMEAYGDDKSAKEKQGFGWSMLSNGYTVFELRKCQANELPS